MPLSVVAGVRTIALSALLIAYAQTTRHYVRVWQSDLTLWAHAATISPEKPRALVNYGLALMRAGRLDAASRAFVLAARAAQRPHVPSYDRADALRAAHDNLETIALLRVVEAGGVR